jgi:hypothetical protein
MIMNNQATVILIPIDNRPITYGFPQMIARVAGIDAVVPPRNLLGSLFAPSSVGALSEWLEDTLKTVKAKALFVCLDSIIYGGLIPSHRSLDSLAEVMERARKIATWKKLAGEDLKIYAQATITRIPHYNDSIEEPEYWKIYGAKIFNWSVLKHKQAVGLLQDTSQLTAQEREIPKEVLADFAQRRERNFQVNQSLIDAVKREEIDYLVFSQDDSGEFGLNVLEKSQLEAQVKQDRLTNIDSYAGADEVIMSLMARWLSHNANRRPKVSVVFSPEEGKNALSNFEGQTIATTITAQMRAANLEILQQSSVVSPDFSIIAHTAGTGQGDHVLLPGVLQFQPSNTAEAVENTINLLQTLPAPVVVCDVAYTNGSDPLLVETLLSRQDLLDKLSAYAAWNTTGNTVGSALALGVANWYARLNGFSTEDYSKQSLFLRLADDWAYQAQVRSQLAGEASEDRVRQLLPPLLKRLANAIGFDPGALRLTLPWKRTFEVEIDIEHTPILL